MRSSAIGTILGFHNTYLMEADLHNKGNADLHNKGNALSSHHKLTFVMEDTSQRWEVDARIIDFSEFLRNMLEDPSPCNQNLIEIELPAFLKTDGKVMQLIIQFYQAHQYQKNHIIIKKIKTSGWHNALDETSRQFAQEQLQSQSQQALRRLLGVCEYLKLNLLKDVICVFIASRHFHCYNGIKMEKELEDMKVFYSRQMEINLKRSMLGYARQLGLDMLEKVQAKHERRRNAQRM